MPFNSRWPLAPAVIDYVRMRMQAAKAETGEEAQVTPNEACAELQRRMLDGSVRARGPLKGVTAELIDAEFWRFALPSTDGAAVNLSLLRKLYWFEVSADDVEREWPNATGAPEPSDNAEFRTGAPGRPSPINLIEREAKRRLEQGVKPPTLARFAQELHDWAEGNFPNGPIPTARTIENKVRPLFKRS